MTRNKTPAFAAAVLLGLAAPASPAQADLKGFDFDAAYSATRIITSGEHRIEQRYFQRDAGTHRMEMHLHGQHSTVITHGERGVMMILMPAQRMYMESSIDGQHFDQTNVELPDPETWVMERVGREPVNGVPATKYRVATDGGEVTRMRGFLWVSDHGIPVRTDMVTGSDRIQMELRDLVVGPQPAELFEAPAGYQRVALGDGMGGLPGGLPGVALPGAVPETGEEPGEAVVTGFVGELATEATEEVKRTTQEEVRETVRDSVRKGLRKILPGN